MKTPIYMILIFIVIAFISCEKEKDPVETVHHQNHFLLILKLHGIQ